MAFETVRARLAGGIGVLLVRLGHLDISLLCGSWICSFLNFLAFNCFFVAFFQRSAARLPFCIVCAIDDDVSGIVCNLQAKGAEEEGGGGEENGEGEGTGVACLHCYRPVGLLERHLLSPTGPVSVAQLCMDSPPCPCKDP